MPDRLYTIKKVCELLSLGHSDVWRLIRRGDLKVVPIIVRGKGLRPRKRVRRSELDRFIGTLGGVSRTSAVEVARLTPRRRARVERELQEATKYY